MTTFGELSAQGVLLFSDGYRTKREELGTSGFRILRVADVQHGWVTLEGEDFVLPEYAREIGVKAAQDGDILLTTKGTIGRVAVVDGLDGGRVVYSPQLCFFRALGKSLISAKYLRYWFSSEEATRQISVYSGNTDMAPYLSLRDLRSLQISLPPLQAQQGIAEVLGALDDKIAANRRIIDSSMSLIDLHYRAASPAEGSKSFAEISVVTGGGTPSTKREDFWGGDVQWATPTDLTSLQGAWLLHTGRTITEEGLAACSSALHPAGSILMTSRATVGALALASAAVAVNQGFIVVQPNEPHDRAWLFAQMRARVPEFVSWANGATFLELSRGNFKRLTVAEASSTNRAHFDALAAPLIDGLLARQRENETLVKTRDELLPLLMSGRITVKDAEKTVEEVV